MNTAKLVEISWAGFDVENIEVINSQLREVVNALHRKDYSVAFATVEAIKARAESLSAQIERRIK